MVTISNFKCEHKCVYLGLRIHIPLQQDGDLVQGEISLFFPLCWDPWQLWRPSLPFVRHNHSALSPATEQNNYNHNLY